MARGKPKGPACLCGECESPVYARGLSTPCYQAAARLVRAEVTTWDELVKAGLALKSARGGKPQRPITKQIAKLAASRG